MQYSKSTVRVRGSLRAALLCLCSETKQRVPGLQAPMHPSPCVIRRHQVRAVGECGQDSWSLGCGHRLRGSGAATRCHPARRVTPRDNRFRAEEPQPPSCGRHTSEGPSEKPGGSDSVFSLPRPWAAVREAFKYPVTWSSLGTQLIARLSAQAPSGWRLGVGSPAGPPHPHPTAPTPHQLHQLQLCAGIHSDDSLLMEVRVE